MSNHQAPKRLPPQKRNEQRKQIRASLEPELRWRKIGAGAFSECGRFAIYRRRVVMAGRECWRWVTYRLIGEIWPNGPGFIVGYATTKKEAKHNAERNAAT